MNIEVTKDEVIIDKNSDKPHENEYNITQCYFTFDDFIESFQVKRAIFTIVSTGEMYETDIINHTCKTPVEVLKHEYETIKLGVYGYNIGENDELVNRFSPSYDTFVVPTGSYQEGALSPEPITPSQYDLYSQALQEGLQEVDNKLDEVVETVDGKIEEVDTKLGEVDDKLEVVDGKIEDIDDAIESTNEAIERTNNLNLDVSDKVDGDVTVTLTKKDASTKTVVISDGTSLQFMWQGTSLGIKTDDMEEYVFVDLQGIQGIKGDTGEPFTIKKTYPSVAEMNADFNNMEYGDYVMIASSVEVEDNAKLYTRGESQWIFITDFSGATGIRGPVGATPNIQIGSVTSGSAPSVTRTGTDENPILNFVLQPGPQGEVGPTGLTGNGISSIEKTSTSGLVDTYTITYTNGNTTTFNVSNGNGIDRIEKTATVGNKDTYTIYFTNGSTTTYEVSNGEVTKEELEEEVERLSMIYNAFPSTTGEGEEAIINGTAEVLFKEISLKGNTSQESTANQLYLSTVGPNNTTYNEKLPTLTNGVVNAQGKNDPNYTTKGNYRNGYVNIGTTQEWKDNTTYYVSFKLQIVSNLYNFDTSYFQVGLYGGKFARADYNSNTGRYECSITTGTVADTDKEKTIIEIRLDSMELNISEVSLKLTEDYTFDGYGPSPTPEHPSPVNVVTGDNEVKIEGKNLFDESQLLNATGWTLNSNGYYNGLFDEYYVAFRNGFTFNTTFEENTQYTIQVNAYCTGGSPRFRVDYTDNTSSQINLNATTPTDYTFTTTSGKTISKIVGEYGTGSRKTLYLKNIQVEKGTTATPYEEHKEQTYPINLGSMELCKIGDYQDYIYKENGIWYKYGAIGKVVLDGSELGWQLSGGTTNVFQNNNYFNGIYLVQDAFCNYYKNVVNSNITANNKADELLTNGQFTFRDGTTKDRIYFKDTRYTSVDDFKNFISTNTPILYYVQNTPTITEITDTTLIEQLDNLEKAYSYDTQTNISQTNQDKPFIISYEAILSLKNILNS